MPDKVHIPEVIEPDAALPADLVALRRFAFLMDEAFVLPGTRIRVGIDAILGLIPGIGDIIGAALSTWIIAGALRHRVPPLVIARMVFNVAVDLIFGWHQLLSFGALEQHFPLNELFQNRQSCLGQLQR